MADQTEVRDVAEAPASQTNNEDSESESEQAPDDEPAGSMHLGMGLKERRALWNSTLPKKLSIYIPHDQDAANASHNYTFIEKDETPTKTYEQVENEKRAAQAKRAARGSFSFLS